SLGRESNSQRGSQIPQIGSWGKGRQGPQSSRFLPTEYKSTIHTGTQQDTRTKRREAGTDEHARTLGSDPQIPTMFHDRDTTLPRLPGTEELEYYSAQQRRVSQQIASLKVEEFGLRISTACNDGDNEEDTQLVARPHATDIGTWTTRETSKENPQSHWGSVSGSGSGGSGSGSAGAEKAFDPLSWSPWDAGFESRPTAAATMDLRHQSPYYHHHHHQHSPQDPREHAAAEGLISFYDGRASQEAPSSSIGPGRPQYPPPGTLNPSHPSAPGPAPVLTPSGPASSSSSSSAASRGRREQDDPDLKRMRNTAASARFRAKKKKREESLERAAKEKRERLSVLEDRIHQLETENQWLKDLILEKHEKLKARSEMVEMKEKESSEKEKGKEKDVAEDDRKGHEKKDGVGT
ncbi:hypothetical protein DH86_00000284, partial [Scytalidium sp. 3C]